MLYIFSLFFKHIICTYILQQGKKSPLQHMEAHAGSVSSSLYNSDLFAE